MLVQQNMTAAAPARANHLQRGFTLLEILVVVVIFGVLISLSTLSVGSFAEDDADEHSRRFTALIELALEEAGIQNRELGLRFYQQGYEFSMRVTELDEDGLPIWVWVPVDTDPIFRSRDLGENFALDVEIDGKEVTLKYERDEEETYTPQIYILSSGDIQPIFKVRIRPAFATEGIMIDVNEFGEVEETRDEF
jgi:general secretion pathway protein H